MALHNPPAPSGFNFRGKCDRRTSRDRSRSSRSGDAIFIDVTNKSFILVTILLITSDQHARGQKVSFLSDGSCFFISASSKRRVLTPATRFRTRGVQRHRRHRIVR